jgi:amidase
MSLAKPETWQSKVAKKQAEVKASIPAQWLIPPSIRSLSVLDIPRQCGILSERELIITESYDARRLLGQLATGQLTSVEVAEAFSKRAAIAQQLVS